MLNQSGITKVSATTEKQILFAPEMAVGVSCKVANTGVEAGTDGKKMVLAGTPLYGLPSSEQTGGHEKQKG